MLEEVSTGLKMRHLRAFVGGGKMKKYLWSDATDLQRGSRCPGSCCSGKNWALEMSNSHSDSTSAPPHHPTRASHFYVRPEWLLCNTDKSVEVRGGGGGTYLDSSWRPSSSCLDVLLSLAPSEAIRKWKSLNRVT